MNNRVEVVRHELARTRLAAAVSPAGAVPPTVEILARVRQLYRRAYRPTRLEEQVILEETLTLALLSGGRPVVLDACGVLLARLGYFPSIDALRRQFPQWTPNLPPRLQAEAAGRIAALAPHGDLEAPYTPFQADLHATFLTSQAASVSAPTSSGKSFVLGRLIYDFAAVASWNVAYIVPTRALIAEVSGRIRRFLRGMGTDKPIRTSPSPLPGSGKSSGHVYVITQERLLALLANPPDKFHLDVLLVDEAQEVQAESGRGILLEAAVEATRRRFPNVRVLMVAPGIPNPEYLLGITQLEPLSGIGHRDYRSPVLHNYVEVEVGSEATRVWLHFDESRVHVQDFALQGPPTEELAPWTALNVHQTGSTTLVYCNSPAQAEAAATWLHKHTSTRLEIDAQVEALATYIQKHVHPGHPLSDMLRTGISTHYGNMPPVVRARIEELAVTGKLQFVCSTSTLLHGVNLPCRNIVICDPRKGNEPLTDNEVRNLAGRAGRIDNDLVGNVWVVSSSAVLPRVPTEVLPPIETAFSKELRAGGSAVAEILDRSVSERERHAYASAFTARAFQLQADGVRLADLAPTPETKVTLALADQRISHERESLKVPPEILAAHHSIAPTSIQLLLDMMLDLDDKKLRKWVPLARRIHPSDEDDLAPKDEDNDSSKSKYNDCKVHFAKVMPYVAKAFSDKRYKWPEDNVAVGKDKAAWRLAIIACHWVNGLSLAWILKGGVKAAAERKDETWKANDPSLIQEAVRETLKTLEEEVRFNLVQQWRLIQDLLRFIYTKVRPAPEVLEGMIDLHLWLEFGTISQEALDIMALGFSRAAAAEIRKAMKKAGVPVASDAGNVIDWLVARHPREVASWGMSPEIWLEICIVSGRNQSEVVWEAPTGGAGLSS